MVHVAGDQHPGVEPGRVEQDGALHQPTTRRAASSITWCRPRRPRRGPKASRPCRSPTRSSRATPCIPQVTVRIVNRYTSKREFLTLRPGEDDGASWLLKRTSGWYDLAITVDGDTQFEYRFAGHLENGEDSSSDPLMGGLV